VMSLWQALAGQHVDESIQVSPGSDNVLKLSFPRVRHRTTPNVEIWNRILKNLRAAFGGMRDYLLHRRAVVTHI
jgi:hypothetical protein